MKRIVRPNKESRLLRETLFHDLKICPPNFGIELDNGNRSGEHIGFQRILHRFRLTRGKACFRFFPADCRLEFQQREPRSHTERICAKVLDEDR